MKPVSTVKLFLAVADGALTAEEAANIMAAFAYAPKIHAAFGVSLLVNAILIFACLALSGVQP